MGDTFLPRILLWQDFSVVVTSRLLAGREDVMTIVFHIFWVAWMDKLFWMVGETTSDAHVRGGPPYPSHKVYPAYQVQLLSQPPKSIFRTIHTSYFQTHTLLNRCLCLQLLVGFSLFFCNWHTPYHTMMGTDLLLVIQIYRIPEKLLSNRKQLEWLNRPIFLAFVIAQLIWLNCYCWVKSSMEEGRFSKWF